jgi:hypothetical protein
MQILIQLELSTHSRTWLGTPEHSSLHKVDDMIRKYGMLYRGRLAQTYRITVHYC